MPPRRSPIVARSHRRTRTRRQRYTSPALPAGATPAAPLYAAVRILGSSTTRRRAADLCRAGSANARRRCALLLTSSATSQHAAARPRGRCLGCATACRSSAPPRRRRLNYVIGAAASTSPLSSAVTSFTVVIASLRHCASPPVGAATTAP